ncbi:unnamed protein product, partial [Prorocentrum cordatum]
ARGPHAHHPRGPRTALAMGQRWRASAASPHRCGCLAGTFLTVVGLLASLGGVGPLAAGAADGWWPPRWPDWAAAAQGAAGAAADAWAAGAPGPTAQPGPPRDRAGAAGAGWSESYDFPRGRADPWLEEGRRRWGGLDRLADWYLDDYARDPGGVGVGDQLDGQPRGLDLSLVGVAVAVLAICAWPRGPTDGGAFAAQGGAPCQAPEGRAAPWQWGGCGGAGTEPALGQGGPAPGLFGAALGAAQAAPWHVGPAAGAAAPPPFPGGQGVAPQAAPWQWGAPRADAAPPLFGLSGWSQAPGAAGAVPMDTSGSAPEPDAYASFGPQMRRWSSALLVQLHQHVLSHLLQRLDMSDLEWQQALAAQGWRLSADSQSGCGLAQFTQGRVLSVFSPNLPAPFCADARAQQMWRERQELESYLRPPMFDAAHQRQHVLERLREWNRRGIAAAMRSDDWRPELQLPTDAHILEALVINLLNSTTRDFSNRYLSLDRSRPPPCAVHCGQYPPAYLRQVADQSAPVPAPHYEVVVGTAVWRLQRSKYNLTEALGLLLSALKQHPQLHAEFPQFLTGAVDAAAFPCP